MTTWYISLGHVYTNRNTIDLTFQFCEDALTIHGLWKRISMMSWLTESISTEPRRCVSTYIYKSLCTYIMLLLNPVTGLLSSYALGRNGMYRKYNKYVINYSIVYPRWLQSLNSRFPSAGEVTVVICVRFSRTYLVAILAVVFLTATSSGGTKWAWHIANDR